VTRTVPIVVCGAGMAGVAAAYHLAALHGAKGIVLVDEREPLTLTSNKGTEGYRNWFPGPGPGMVRFMNRSIDLLEALVEESGGSVRMNRRGYVMLTRDRARLDAMARAAGEIAALGAGALRRHPGSAPYVPADPLAWDDAPVGADLIEDPGLIRREWPYLAPGVRGALHVRRAGFLDSWGAGQWMLMHLARSGVEIRRERITAIDTTGGRVRGVTFASGAALGAEHVVLAAGPLLPRAARMLGLELPVFCELHAKLALRDTLGAVPREAPMLIWNDPVELEWSETERASLAADPAAAPLLGPLPEGVHVRPRERTRELLLIWTYDATPREPEWPPRHDPHYGEALIRAAAHMIPGLRACFGRAAEGVVDGGYYCKTPENRPLIGPLPIEGAWIIGALSGFGIMGCHAAGDLLAAHMLGRPLPEYAAAFLPSRHDDPAYAARMRAGQGWSGQL
jgi:glycine/D-amino acid oxidase-like deaminating enzyme